MTETTTQQSFRYVCGKCAGGGLYRDDDFLVGDFSIVCPICGNRYYGDIVGGIPGVAPVKVYCEPKPDLPLYGPSRFTLERTANILTGPELIRAKATEKTEESMSVTRACGNCKRVLSIIGEGCCYVCYHAGKGLTGTAKDDARAAIKAKIDSGGLKKGAPRCPRPKGIIAPVDKFKTGVLVPGGAEDMHAFAHWPLREGEKIVAGWAVEGVQSICITFPDERDRKLYDVLVAAARRFRRSPEQQILWMVQDALEQEADI